MPKPIFKKNNIILNIEENVKLLKEIDKSITIEFKKNTDTIFLKSDTEQLNRVFLNLIKNSIESIQEKALKNQDFSKKINIEIDENNEHISVIIIDNGIGFKDINNNVKEILKPYFTTKKNGTGLGLSIVNKIINDHNGSLNFFSINNGAKLEILFFKDDSRNTNSWW